MSPAGARLLRSILGRVAEHSDRILLTEYRSIDWQSLTFIGEQHRFGLRIAGPDASVLRDSLCDGIEDAEFFIPGHLLAGIEVEDHSTGSDGAVGFSLVALTIRE